MEITNDVQFLLPIMATIMVAKWVGDFMTHPFYHAVLELKCIPFLDSEPVILNKKRQMYYFNFSYPPPLLCSSYLSSAVFQSKFRVIQHQ